MSVDLNISELVIPDETKHQIYLDGAQPTVSETGKLIGRIPRAINAAFAPLDIWIEKQEYNVKRTKELLNKNLENVNPEKIVPPEPYVAVPAIQSLSYSMDSDELRKMYANLLAKSIYSDTKDYVHPAFAEIIKNLSPLDCKVFDLIMNNEYHEIGCYELRVGTVGESSYHVIYPYVTAITIDSPERISASIDNLSRNKLITPKDFHYNDDNLYSIIRNTPFFQSMINSFSSNPGNRELRPYKMSIQSTDWGKAFFNICCTAL